jgi:hypothetical protein
MKPRIIQSRKKLFDGSSGLTPMPRKMLGRAMSTMEESSAPSSTARVVVPRTNHL